MLSIEKISGQTPTASEAMFQIRCKDSRIVRFDFKGKIDTKIKIEKLISQFAFPESGTAFFAFSFKLNPSSSSDALSLSNDIYRKDGWNLFNIFEETLRMRLPFDKWQISDINFDYSKSKTYPSKIIVPIGISDDELDAVFAYRSKGRIPALSWVHPTNHAVLTRSR